MMQPGQHRLSMHDKVFAETMPGCLILDPTVALPVDLERQAQATCADAPDCSS